MPRFQLAVASTVLASAVVSAAVFAVYQPATGTIRLLDDEDEQPELEGEKDPFDVTTAEDMVDGTPLFEDAFWQQVRRVRSMYCAISNACTL